jgi:hypothetical protein
VPHGVVYLLHGRAFKAHRVVKARAHFSRGIVVVDDVDATNKGDPVIDYHQLAVQAAQAMSGKVKAPDLGAVEHGLNPGFGQLGHKVSFEIPPAEAVHRSIYLYAALCRSAECTGNGMADFIVRENVAFEVNFLSCSFDRSEQGGEIFGPRVEQSQPVARQKFSRHAR